jgi:kynurenine formamidase
LEGRAPNERVKTLYTVDKDGFRINEYCHIGQWGTHVDPPATLSYRLAKASVKSIRKICSCRSKTPPACSIIPVGAKRFCSFLYEKRNITASGHETTDTDPGLATTKDDYSLESYILGTNHYQIELLANLDQVPEAEALVWVTFPKVEDGSGFPARVMAVVP